MLRFTSSRVGLTVEAPAKVNLTLRVLGVRPDGYHHLESVVAGVGLYDVLLLEPADGLHFSCDDPSVPAGDENLVMKAARLLRETRPPPAPRSLGAGGCAGARIYLKKVIPSGRGLGGGSSDAAAALAGLNALWRCGRTPAELAALGATLGSDVPLFFGPPLAVMRGRGERIEPVEARPRWWVVLAWPEHGNPTPEVYAAFDRLPQSGPRPYRAATVTERCRRGDGAVAVGDARRPAATDILKVLDGPARAAAGLLVNDLESAARQLRPDAPHLRQALEQAGAAAVGMTGSGSAYFALADTEAEARRLAAAVRGLLKNLEAVAAPLLPGPLAAQGGAP